MSELLDENWDKADWMMLIMSSATSALDVNFDNAWIDVDVMPSNGEQ